MVALGTHVVVIAGPYAGRRGVVQAILPHSLVRVVIDELEACKVDMSNVQDCSLLGVDPLPGASPSSTMAGAVVGGGLPASSSSSSSALSVPVQASNVARPPPSSSSTSTFVRHKRLLSEALASTAGGPTLALAKAYRLRVTEPGHRLVGSEVSLVSIDATGYARVVLAGGGQTPSVVATNSLEIVDPASAGAASVAVGAEQMLAGAKVQRHTFVKVTSGHPLAGVAGLHYVFAAKGDEQYEVYIEGKGKYVIHSDHLLTEMPRYNRRPHVRIVLPSGPRHGGGGGEWTDEQRDALHRVLQLHRSIFLTGVPGGGKSAVTGRLVKALQDSGFIVQVNAVSNSITAFLRSRYLKEGVADIDCVGTHSSKGWASLGRDFSYDNEDDIVLEILTAPYTRKVREGIRETHVFVFEEDENTLPHFKDLRLRIISRVCGHLGPEPGADKLYIYVGDERQLGGIAVEDGSSGKSKKTVASGGSAVGGGEAAEVMSYESQVLQKFYPNQPVTIQPGHWQSSASGSSNPPGAPVKGTVVRYCSLRERFLVKCPNASSLALAGFGDETTLVKIEKVSAEHLEAESRRANVDVVHLTKSHRVAAGNMLDGVELSQQSAEAVWHAACHDLHSGITNSPVVMELFKRLLDVGSRMPTEVPESFSLTQFGFQTNKRLEAFAPEHVERFEVEETWAKYPGVDLIHNSTALKCDGEGVVLHSSRATSWDVPGTGGRQHVAGAVAIHMYWKVGYELVVGTFPQHLTKTSKPLKIPIGGGDGKDFGFLKPGDRIVPILELQGSGGTHGGVEYNGILVECPGCEWIDGKGYPTAILPWLMYQSAEIMGEVLHWLSPPWKYRLLTTTHANTGRGFLWYLAEFEYVWCFDSIFSSLTRAMEPPGPVGEPILGRKGCFGVRVLKNERGDFYNPTGLALGLHPKTALRWRDVYGKAVPEERLRTAEEWLVKHKRFHLSIEEHTIERLKVNQNARPNPRSYGDS